MKLREAPLTEGQRRHRSWKKTNLQNRHKRVRPFERNVRQLIDLECVTFRRQTQHERLHHSFYY
jgi:hypothetical protein